MKDEYWDYRLFVKNHLKKKVYLVITNSERNPLIEIHNKKPKILYKNQKIMELSENESDLSYTNPLIMVKKGSDEK